MGRGVVLAAVLALAAPVAPAGRWIRPVDGPVTRHFEAPEGPFGPGHRGIDFAVPAGTAVRAVDRGVVAFAGPVAGALHVVVAHPGGLRASYTYLGRVTARAGREVDQGSVVGFSGGRGPGHTPDVFHFGVRRRGRYIDPAPLLGLAAAEIRLAPVDAGDPAPCAVAK